MSVENKNSYENISSIDAGNETKEALKKGDINAALESRLSAGEIYYSETEQTLEGQIHLAQECLNFSPEKTQDFCHFFDTNLLQTV